MFIFISAVITGCVFHRMNEKLKSTNVSEEMLDCENLCNAVSLLDRSIRWMNAVILWERILRLLLAIYGLCEEHYSPGYTSPLVYVPVTSGVVMLTVYLSVFIYAMEQECNVERTLTVMVWSDDISKPIRRNIRARLFRIQEQRSCLTVAGIMLSREAAVTVFVTLLSYTILIAELSERKLRSQDANHTLDSAILEMTATA
ncbi:uncharacterized protein LOC129582831 [Paramacrobiotus metropolitanus]|uniref:uncharacterized protein LOC129582831 n=1 Tax=Paramacrobiotus metropolitanus TaxID=2943436 RepID=UPI002445BDC7|nr:uncharacterized protein LOC129582831 [Paramacrobiotus metropolitanus]